MRAVIQRVSRASVGIEGAVAGAIDSGYLVLLGVEQGDGDADLRYIIDKTLALRVWPDEAGKMNRTLAEAAGALLVISQFTLLGDCRNGNRPSFIQAERPERAREMYEQALAAFRSRGVRTEAGKFGAMMAVELVNDGPVTILLDSKKKF